MPSSLAEVSSQGHVASPTGDGQYGVGVADRLSSACLIVKGNISVSSRDSSYIKDLREKLQTLADPHVAHREQLPPPKLVRERKRLAQKESLKIVAKICEARVDPSSKNDIFIHRILLAVDTVDTVGRVVKVDDNLLQALGGKMSIFW